MELDHIKRATNGNEFLESDIKNYVNHVDGYVYPRQDILDIHDELSLGLLKESESYPSYQYYDSMRVALLQITESTVFRLKLLE